MDELINLEDLLRHELLDLYSAEEQIIEALPAMIENASNTSLKQALNDHLVATKRHKERLDRIKEMILLHDKKQDEGFLSKLFGGNKNVKSKGIEVLITDAENIMGEAMNSAVKDAAIVASAQKVEHYEIAGYGTAIAYARELQMDFVANELEETLEEEYDADQLLSELAIDEVNENAEDDINDVSDETKEDYSKPGVDHLATSPIEDVFPGTANS